MFSRVSTRPLSLPVLVAVILIAAGCGSSSPSGTAAPTTSTSTSTHTTAPGATTGASLAPPTTRGPFPDASVEVQKMLRLAKAGTRITPQGTVPAWASANGSGIPATPTHLSGFGFVVDKAKNIQYLSFAVKDTSGRCAGGDVLANGSGTKITGGKPITVPAKAPCTGDEVAKLAGHL
jgi:hypothetical protein